jgi:hypothetical protein
VPFIRYEGGPAVHDGYTPPERISSAQALHRRNALWLQAVTGGIYDPATRSVRRYEPQVLAALWEVWPSTVRGGIKDARRLQSLEVSGDE